MEYTENFQQFYIGFCWLPFCKILPHKNILWYNLCYVNLLKIVPLIQEGNEGFVHHMIMFECFGNFTEKDFDEGVPCSSRANMPYQKCGRYAMVAAWAVGGQVKYSLISNWQEFSITSTPIDHSNDVKMLKISCKVLNILKSFWWSIRVRTLKSCCRSGFWNNTESFDMHFRWSFWVNRKREKENKHIAALSQFISMVCTLIEHRFWPIMVQEIFQLSW